VRIITDNFLKLGSSPFAQAVAMPEVMYSARDRKERSEDEDLLARGYLAPRLSVRNGG